MRLGLALLLSTVCLTPAFAQAAPPAAAPASVPTAPTPAGSDATATKALSNEGTLLTNRRGRLIRLAQEGGRLALVLDNDPNSPGGTP